MPGIEKIFGVVLSAVGFDLVVMAQPPIGLADEASTLPFHAQVHVPFLDGDGCVVIGESQVLSRLSQRVEIAHVHEDEQTELDRSRAIRFDFVSDLGDVLQRDELQPFDDADAFNVEFPGSFVAQGKFAEVSVAARVEVAAAEIVDGEFEQARAVAVEVKQFADAAQRHHPSDRRIHRRAEQAVVAALVASDDGGGSESAEAVGEEPFLMKMRFQVPVGLDLVVGHEGSLTRGDHNRITCAFFVTGDRPCRRGTFLRSRVPGRPREAGLSEHC